MIKETDRPLGQERRPQRRLRQRRFSLGLAAAASCAMLLVGASAYISLRPGPFRDPPQSIVSTPALAEAMAATRKQEPERAGPPPASDLARAAVQEASTGPKIIHVAPSAHKDGLASGIPASSDIHHFTSLPDRALIEESEMGPLPVRGPDGRRPFDVYARPSSPAKGPRIAIVIGGLGLSQTGTQAAIEKLPADVTLAFAPQGNSLDRWMRAARQAGHEVMIQLPLDPYDYPNVNPGRNTLTVSASPSQTLRQLRWALSRITNYAGVMNYMGARYTSNEDAMEVLMDELAERGLLYLDDGTSSRSLAGTLADKDGVPFAMGDEVIDAARDKDAVIKQLESLEETARQKGSAIGTGSAFGVTIDAVAGWIDNAASRGITIVPVTALARDPENDQVANGK